MPKFKPYRKDQVMLFPKTIDEYVPQNHLSRLICHIVEELDTSNIEVTYSSLGQNTYHPKILLKLLFYGYATGVRSGRKISTKCETDTAYIYLAQMYHPDFRTINDFRKNHMSQLSDYFIAILRMCRELGLVSLGQINIDGTKIRANATNRRTKTKEGYKRWLKRIDDKIKKILEEAEATDTKEDELFRDKRGDELPCQIQNQQKLKDKIRQVMGKFKDEKEKINLTDPDAKFMKDGHCHIDTSYNCQAVLSKEQFILANEVIREPSDRQALSIMVEATDKNLGQPIKGVAADAGYSSYDNYEYLEKNNKVGYIPDQYLRKGNDPYHQDHFVYDPEKDIFLCPEGKMLKLYKIRREERSYRKFQSKIYQAQDCPACSKKSCCTRQHYRTISIEDRKALLLQMRKRLQTKAGRKKYLQRLWTTEPFFGHLKYNLGYRHFFLRSLKKVKGEFRLMCIGWNLKKMHKLMALG
ncbi:MAG: hypothetical protein APR54_11900 [Candidatus Cloacimonas sp. SDB]|nr:MAG: hypothetical protein APR54_11900 [Candidatus Cloacimonas sp. SDB]